MAIRLARCPGTTAIGRAAYRGLPAAHLHSVRAALEDHVARVERPREGDVDPSSATAGDLARLPPIVKQEAQAQ